MSDEEDYYGVDGKMAKLKQRVLKQLMSNDKAIKQSNKLCKQASHRQLIALPHHN